MNTQGHVWDRFFTHPSGSLNIFFWACQCYQSSWSKYVTRWLLLSISWFDQHNFIFPRRLFIIGLWYTFIDILRNLHAFKHVNFFKVIDPQSKPCTCACLLQLLGTILRKYRSIQSLHFFRQCCPKEQSQLPININQTSRVSYNF